MKSKPQPEQLQSYIVDQLEDWADIMRQEIQIKDYPNGWFNKHYRCAKGQDIIDWVLEHGVSNRNKV